MVLSAFIDIVIIITVVINIIIQDYSESVLLLCDMCDKRQQDLNDPEKKERILSALSGLKRAIPILIYNRKKR